MLDEAALSDLVVMVREGSQEALETVVAEFRPRIMRFALSRLGDEHTAEDVTQEACMALVSSLPTFEDRGVKLSSYVFAITNNKIIDSRRSAARRPAATTDEILVDEPSTGEGPEALAVRSDQVRRLAEPLAALPERDRTILLMRVVAQLTADEVAEALGMTAGAVRVAQHRALKALRGQLSEGVMA